MSSRLVALSFESHDPAVMGAFWAGLLGREIVEEPGGVLLPGAGSQLGLRFVDGTTEKSGWNRLHLHVTTSSSDAQQEALETVVRLGGRRRGTKPLPKDADIFMADPDGNEFCLIEPGSAYYAGAGLLGDVTCDGGPEVGLFWRDALGWALVWDEDDQTAIQSLAGGTKISFDTWPDPPRAGRDRQRFDLAASDPDAEAQRLVFLGATRVRVDGAGRLILADPGGDEFSLSRG
jgi:catechol 2,3-dioxygenase-like lactoylglutathione lyase family enzyme